MAKKFPDLNKDGKITQADILKGRGVFNEGGKTILVPPEREEYGLGSLVAKGVVAKASKAAFREAPDMKSTRNQFAEDLEEAGIMQGESVSELFDLPSEDLKAMSPQGRKLFNALKNDDFLGFDTVDEAARAVFNEDLDNFDASPQLKRALGEYVNKYYGGARMEKAEGGALLVPVEMEAMPVDTYPNIPPEEMDDVMASQKPDEKMEDDFVEFVLGQSLEESEMDYLMDALEADDQLSMIFDKVILASSEFSGAGEVEGPGDGTSDSIPARLSDGEFVFTKKATDQIGVDNLQRMMDDAERAYDGGLMKMAEGGMVDEPPTDEEEIKNLMLQANRMPSLMN